MSAMRIVFPCFPSFAGPLCDSSTRTGSPSSLRTECSSPPQQSCTRRAGRHPSQVRGKEAFAAASGAGTDRPRAVSAIRSGGDVVVEVKDVVGVVAALDIAESLVVGAVGGPDGVVALVVAEVIEPAAGGGVGPQRGGRLASPADV